MIKPVITNFIILIPLFLIFSMASCQSQQDSTKNEESKAQSNSRIEQDRLVKYLELKIKQDPDNYEKYDQLAQTCMQRARDTGDVGYYLRAESALEKSLDLNPDSYYGNLYMGLLKQSLHHFRESLSYLNKAIEIKPEDNYGYGALGDAYLQLGNYDKTEEMYTKMNKMNPSLESYSRISNLKRSQGDFDSAINYMEKAYEDGLKNSKPKENIAWTQAMIGEIYFEKGDMDNAEKYYEKSLEISDNYYLAMQKLAKLQYDKGNYGEAEDLYKKVIAINSRPEMYIALGDVYKKMGKYSLSGKQYTKAKEIIDKYKKQGFDAFHAK